MFPIERRALSRDPLWYKDAIVYEVHVKSFYDSNGDGVGDFQGLTQKLDYLEDLGINCIWLLPFYPSPLRDDGYDIADYRNVHAAYGTLRDFRQFVREAHRRGIRVITELVINHTSDLHPWFQAARRAPAGSLKRDYYVWSATNQKYHLARIIFKDYEKSNWTWDDEAKAYYWHRFFHHQPDLNFDNPHVRRAIMRVMRFWLDMGVDGLRLDAVPYLVEREGTICENLPETHAVLKEIRRELDVRYRDRMLLAEANQWPADVRPYFGDGDECHMAFHFPLMPRIFMALRQEDRHPVTEILRQTPEIPDNCQWAIFLRNHDELTLEMVTDEERDYMYHEYAVDPLMRLNLGIRRRLAPLLNNSRRRLELLNSLLFSFPGTPIIYYGDEIGMGDNIYMGDRNGVRTPMQWSGDRNAGFSRGDFARLYTPPIMDSVYGYQSVNVEAQMRDPSSLLNWMKRMIAVSKRFKTFGRGELEFLNPANRKVLAYVRRYGEEIFLAVANLSRFVQPAELNLAAFEGFTPIEMLGSVEFPRVGKLPYFLTLGPHSFYWFHLQRVAAPLEVAPAAAEPARAAPVLPAAACGRPMESLLDGGARSWLEKEVLPLFLSQQRWYGAKAEALRRLRVVDHVRINQAPVAAFILIVETEFASGRQERYTVPLSLVRRGTADAIREAGAAALAGQLQTEEGTLWLADSLAEEAFCRWLLGLVERPRALAAARGRVQGVRSAGYAVLEGEPLGALPIHRGGEEQSNTSVRYGNRLILKFYRRLEAGVNPDYEIGRYLTEEASFDRTPKIMGGILYEPRDGEPGVMAMLQELVENQGDGWSHALDELARFFDGVSGRMDAFQSLSEAERRPSRSFDGPWPPAVQELVGSYLYSATILGRRTAEMHRALGASRDRAAFAPEPLTRRDTDRILHRVQDEAADVFRSLETVSGRLGVEDQWKVRKILDARGSIEWPAADLHEIPGGKIRCHGDYHLGQVLWTNNDYVILDFEGEPARSLAERRAKQSPLKDVAGMLRSFHYAAHAGLRKLALTRPQDFAKFEPVARFWYSWSSVAFLREYVAASAGAGFLPAEAGEFESLLDLFLWDKTLYEVRYERNNRPDWLGIPLEGLLSLMRQPAGAVSA